MSSKASKSERRQVHPFLLNASILAHSPISRLRYPSRPRQHPRPRPRRLQLTWSMIRIQCGLWTLL